MEIIESNVYQIFSVQKKYLESLDKDDNSGPHFRNSDSVIFK